MKRLTGSVYSVCLGVWIFGLGCARADPSPHTPWFSSNAPAQEFPATGIGPSSLRVAVLHSKKPVVVSCSGLFYYTSSGQDKKMSLAAHSLLKIKLSRNGLLCQSKTIRGDLRIIPADVAIPLSVNGRLYRGTLLIKPHRGTMDVIEQVGLESYLYGVLPREVGTDWPADALKAQAVVSRTFVLSNMGKYAARGYDLSNDVSSQVYGGVKDESPLTSQAVDATAGQTLVDKKGMPIQAFFHSSCGGHTENPRYVWKDMADAPGYLLGVPDEFCKEDPYYTWHARFSSKFIRKRLRAGGYSVGTIKDISISKASPSGRAWFMAITSSSGKTSVPGNRFRTALGVDGFRSTWITHIKKESNMFNFEGHGWGHGVGLCQWGARGRALAGQSYQQILDAYFPGASLVPAKP